MASRKRLSNTLDEDDDLEVESASSSLQHNKHKRSRLALAAERGGSTVSDEDDGDDMLNAPSRMSSVMSEAESDSEDEEKLQRLEALGTQYIERRFKKHRENVASEHGIVEEIACRNFMCHSNLKIHLGPLINFVIGHNGSGKSAVLTALTVCLGGRAAASNRGASLKDMIKQGTEQASVSVKIKNQGSSAYRSELYGRSIIVERHFARSGTSGFKIKNAQERIISTKKRDLDDIIDHFGLQLDNPINVLNQDMARQFLSNSSPEEKYKFFLRGTRLETLDHDYKIIEITLEDIEGRLISREEDLTVLQQMVNEASDRKKRLEISTSIRLEITKTQRMHAWAQVEEQEQELEGRKKEIGSAEAQLATAEQNAETAGGAYEGADQALETAKRRVQEIQVELDPINAKLKEDQDVFDTNKRRLLELHGDQRSAKTAYQAEKSRKQKIQGDIEAERNILAEANGHEHTDRLERMDQLKADLAAAKEDQTTHEGSLPDLEKTRGVASDVVEKARGIVDEQRQQVESEHATLDRMQRDSDQRHAGYNRNLNKLLQAIGRTSWTTTPIGPIGIHIKVTEQKWTGLIERQLGSLLDNFIVTTREDQTKLKALMQSVSCISSIIIGNPRILDTTGKEPEGNILTMLRALDIDNEMVRNQLIIQMGIEQVVLIENVDACSRFMFDEARPRNVRRGLAFDGSGIGGVRFEYTRTGSSASGGFRPWHGSSRLKASRNDQLASQKNNLAAAKREHERRQEQLRAAQQQHQTAKQAIEKYKRARQQKTAAIQQLNDEIENLQEEIESNRPKDGRLQELERQLKQVETDEANARNIVEDLVRQRAVMDEAQREIKDRLNEITAKVEEHDQHLDKARREQERLEAKRMAALRGKNEAIQVVNDCKEWVQKCIEARDKQQRVVNDEFMPAAQSVCPRISVDPGMTTAKLDERLEQFQLELIRAEREAGGSLEELTLAWKEASTAHIKCQKEHNDLKQLSDKLKQSLAQRRRTWKVFRQLITARARCTFTYLLSERSFRGQLLINHHEKQLGLAVEPNGANKSDSGREARTLSGGEKSFSTICLLLSIWEAMGSPIRCLDEFDVFMDSANRQTSMKMMIEAARRSVGRQFILITPQAMQDVALGDDVSIHRMADPERNQTTLPFTRT